MRHSQAVKDKALELRAQGLSLPEISRTLGVAVSTVHTWVTPAGMAYIQHQKIDPECRERKKALQRTPEYKERRRIRQRASEYREYNKEYLRRYRQSPGIKERERERKQTSKYREQAKNYLRRRRATDTGFRTLDNLRRRVNNALRGGVKSASTRELLGISAWGLVERWDAEYGLGWQDDCDLHVDHVRPCSSFDLEDPAQQRACFNWRNLQLLPAAENIRKNGSWTEEMESAWAGRMRNLGWEGDLFLAYSDSLACYTTNAKGASIDGRP